MTVSQSQHEILWEPEDPREAVANAIASLRVDGIEPNALHPFREGNGRTQRAFLSQLARDAGFRLDWATVDRDANIDAARAAADGDLAPMRALLDPVGQRARRAPARRGGGQRISR